MQVSFLLKIKADPFALCSSFTYFMDTISWNFIFYFSLLDSTAWLENEDNVRMREIVVEMVCENDAKGEDIEMACFL